MTNTPRPNPVMGNGRIRDDLSLGSAEQDYLLRVEPKPQGEQVTEARAAAITACQSVVLRFAGLPHVEQVAMSADLIDQLGVAETLKRPRAA